GGEVAADLTAAFRAQAQGKEAVRVERGLLDAGEDASRFDGDRIVEGIDLQDAVHAAEIEHDLVTRRGRRGAARPARVSSPGDHARARSSAEFAHRRPLR